MKPPAFFTYPPPRAYRLRIDPSRPARTPDGRQVIVHFWLSPFKARDWLRAGGIPVPALIHNGRKATARRKRQH